MRLFFAAFPDDEMRSRIASAADALELGEGTRRVPAENYHVTLAFAGEVSNAQAGALRTLESIDISPFAVRFDAHEHWLKSEVVVIAATEWPSALDELRCKLRAHLDRQGIAPDPQPFHPHIPHITIARKVTQPPVHQAMSGLLWTVTNFQLLRSMRSTAGSVYTVVDHWPLLDEPSAVE